LLYDGPIWPCHVWFFGGRINNFIILGLGLSWLYHYDGLQTTIIDIMIFLSTGLVPFLFDNWQMQTMILLISLFRYWLAMPYLL
jgi:hypothetical protein